MKKLGSSILILLVFIISGFFISREININPWYEIGEKIDSLNGVVVYYNAPTKNTSGRHLTEDGYNLGLKYQCVEFVKRYYYEALKHKMPNSYGNAKDFYNSALNDGEINKQRNLTQYTNHSKSKPKVNDLIVYSQSLFNEYGHVSIISKVSETDIQIIQQNAGPFCKSRETYRLTKVNGKWYIENKRILGWLRK